MSVTLWGTAAEEGSTSCQYDAAGHSSVMATFNVYGHLFASSLDADRDRLDAYLAETARPKNVPRTNPWFGGLRRGRHGCEMAQPCGEPRSHAAGYAVRILGGCATTPAAPTA